MNKPSDTPPAGVQPTMLVIVRPGVTSKLPGGAVYTCSRWLSSYRSNDPESLDGHLAEHAEGLWRGIRAADDPEKVLERECEGLLRVGPHHRPPPQTPSLVTLYIGSGGVSVLSVDYPTAVLYAVHGSREVASSYFDADRSDRNPIDFDAAKYMLRWLLNEDTTDEALYLISRPAVVVQAIKLLALGEYSGIEAARNWQRIADRAPVWSLALECGWASALEYELQFRCSYRPGGRDGGATARVRVVESLRRTPTGSGDLGVYERISGTDTSMRNDWILLNPVAALNNLGTINRNQRWQSQPVLRIASSPTLLSNHHFVDELCNYLSNPENESQFNLAELTPQKYTGTQLLRLAKGPGLTTRLLMRNGAPLATIIELRILAGDAVWLIASDLNWGGAGGDVDYRCNLRAAPVHFKPTLHRHGAEVTQVLAAAFGYESRRPHPVGHPPHLSQLTDATATTERKILLLAVLNAALEFNCFENIWARLSPWLTQWPGIASPVTLRAANAEVAKWLNTKAPEHIETWMVDML